MKYAWIADHCNVYGVATLCRVLQVSRCGYHQNQGRAPSERSMANRIVVAHLKQFHQEYCHTYGRRRMRHALLAEGIAAGE